MKHQFLNGDEIRKDTDTIKIKKFNARVVSIESYAYDTLVASIADGFAIIEADDIRVSDIVMNHDTYSRFAPVFRDMIDETNTSIILAADRVGMLWGAHIWRHKDCPNSEIMVYGENGSNLLKDFPSIATNKAFIN